MAHQRHAWVAHEATSFETLLEWHLLESTQQRLRQLLQYGTVKLLGALGLHQKRKACSCRCSFARNCVFKHHTDR